jgi:hypothetical protein
MRLPGNRARDAIVSAPVIETPSMVAPDLSSASNRRRKWPGLQPLTLAVPKGTREMAEMSSAEKYGSPSMTA